MVILSGYVKFKYTKMSNQLAEDVTSDFRIKLFNFLLSQDYSYFFKSGTNVLLSKLTQKTTSFTLFVFASVNIFNSILITTAIFTVLIINEPFYTPVIIFSILSFFFIVLSGLGNEPINQIELDWNQSIKLNWLGFSWK